MPSLRDGLSKAAGREGEDLAARYLERSGYAILARNYRCNLGEIDIIARKKRLIVFVEVKTRRGRTYGSGLEAVTERKQAQIVRVAKHYLSVNRVADQEFRFDAMAVGWDDGRPMIEHVPGAFEAVWS